MPLQAGPGESLVVGFVAVQIFMWPSYLAGMADLLQLQMQSRLQQARTRPTCLSRRPAAHCRRQICTAALRAHAAQVTSNPAILASPNMTKSLSSLPHFSSSKVCVSSF